MAARGVGLPKPPRRRPEGLLGLRLVLASAGIGARSGTGRPEIPAAGRPGARAAERARDAAAAGGQPLGISFPS
jgi:hypothetical protein